MQAPIFDVPAHARRPGRLRRHRAAPALLIVAVIAMLLLSAGAALAASGGTGSKSGSLSLGSTGSAVKQLQRKLGVRPVSGYFGTETSRAVKRYQAHHGLTADGVAGPATLSRLGIRVSKSGYATGGSAPSSGSSGSSSGSSSSGGSNVKLPAALKR
ncbi:MAG: zinc D-Ala-D-Ala carboxypeptidase, partial [Thermoleophilaceae bacterium]|nr:zinc D-Ala-D-Ala carboxypeptidase [Thermoleophilaceae bacterium]